LGWGFYVIHKINSLVKKVPFQLIKVEKETLQNKVEEIYTHCQEHIFCFWDRMSTSERANLLQQITNLDLLLLSKLVTQALKRKNTATHTFKLAPAEVITLKQREGQDKHALNIGEEHIRAGKVGAFLVAGGQGTRLGFEGPKGMYPVTPVKQKTLYQLHAEKLFAMSKKYAIEIPWYIMTSETNNQATVDFFEEYRFFGLQKENVFFLIQDMIPAIDKNGKLMLDAANHIFMNPNGHGGSIKALNDSGALSDMKTRGIETIFYFQVDNVLTKVCDPVYIGYHVSAESEMSNKVVRKKYAQEKMGVLCKIDDRLGLVEYSDLDKKSMVATNPDGSLKYGTGNIATHLFSVDFIEKENRGGFKLPYHIAEKNIPFLDRDGKLIKPDTKNGIKFETFIFDALRDADKTTSIEVERIKEFSPLKNKEGENSPQTVRQSLNNTYGRWLEEAGHKISRDQEFNVDIDLEISPLFALDEKELVAKHLNFNPDEKNIYFGES
jgi:UDP-N-acetylglucosamine/UDP-N-acetylgalactosamine diphosphorylase